jgi:hypothetical protein
LGDGRIFIEPDELLVIGVDRVEKTFDGPDSFSFLAEELEDCLPLVFECRMGTGR